MKLNWLFDSCPFLSSEKLTLCRIQPTEAKAVEELFRDLQEDNCLPETRSADPYSVNAFFREVDSSFKTKRSVTLGIFFNDDLNRLLGVIQIGNLEPSTESAELRFFLRKRFRGRGAAAMAVSAVVKFLFERVEVNRIWASALAENAACERVLLSCGFLKEGTARQAVFWKGRGVVSLSTYSLLREEYALIGSSGLIAREEDLSVVRMNGGHFEALVSWLSDPRVLKNYGELYAPPDLAGVVARFGPFLSEENPVTPCIIRQGNKDVGYLQFCPIDPADRPQVLAEQFANPYRIRLFLAEEARGRGVGARAVRMVCSYLINRAGADAVIAIPRERDLRSVNTFLKCGFRQVTSLPNYSLREGEAESCLLLRREKE